MCAIWMYYAIRTLHHGMTLSEYANTEISRVASTAFVRHLWYLSEILIAFDVDEAVTTEEKRLVVAALHDVEG